jgi:hypothetical protein
MEKKKNYDYQISVGDKGTADDRKYLDLTPTYYNPNRPLEHRPFDGEPVGHVGQAGGEYNRQALTPMKGLDEGRRKEQDLISYINQKRDQIFKKNRYDSPAEGDPKSGDLSANFKKTPEISPQKQPFGDQDQSGGNLDPGKLRAGYDRVYRIDTDGNKVFVEERKSTPRKDDRKTAKVEQ